MVINHKVHCEPPLFFSNQSVESVGAVQQGTRPAAGSLKSKTDVWFYVNSKFLWRQSLFCSVLFLAHWLFSPLFSKIKHVSLNVSNDNVDWM